ncbi:hypothetical protein [Brassicibacter mesophilus]|uniref:hypothetical protein n=1 Tax=Brassicibacter mesophilus TaxID=745119 RepID=UPI003D1D1B4C
MVKTIAINENEVREIFNDETWDALDNVDFRNTSVIFDTFGQTLNSDVIEFEVDVDEKDELTDIKLKNMILEDLRDLHINLSM